MVRLHPSQCTEVRSELAFVAVYVGQDLSVYFEEIIDIMQCIGHAFTLPETVIGLCQ